MRRLKHADNVISAVESGSVGSRLTASWRRSLNKHGLDPTLSHAPRRYERSEVDKRRDSMGSFMELATPKLDNLTTGLLRISCLGFRI